MKSKIKKREEEEKEERKQDRRRSSNYKVDVKATLEIKAVKKKIQ